LTFYQKNAIIQTLTKKPIPKEHAVPRKIFNYTAQCPHCLGKGQVRVQDDVYIDCETCHSRGHLQKGRFHIGKLREIYKQITSKVLTCEMCNGTGRRKNNSRKTCLGCDGTRLRHSLIILHLPDGDKNLHEYFHRND